VARQDTVLIIDGLHFIYRGNIAFGNDSSRVGFPVVYNFFRNLRAIIEQFSPDKVFFVLEGGNNFRYKLRSDYKANRIVKKAAALPQEEFDAQRDIIVELLQYLPISVVKVEGLEADDTIWGLAKSLASENVIIVGSDKDFVQCLQHPDRGNLKLYDPVKKEFVTSPDYHFITFLALAGDRADNIPSLVSKEKAKEIARQPAALMEFLHSEEHRADYNLNLQLITLREFADEQLDVAAYNTNFAALKESFVQMDCKTLVEQNYWQRFCQTFKRLR
jgi:5'-3' exonuclease